MSGMRRWDESLNNPTRTNLRADFSNRYFITTNLPTINSVGV